MSPLLKHLSTTLADKQAVNTILDSCSPVVIEGVIWRNTDELRNCSSVIWEVKYLKMRGLLIHHPLIYTLVRLKGHDEKSK
jgi:hypothetical protein